MAYLSLTSYRIRCQNRSAIFETLKSIFDIEGQYKSLKKCRISQKFRHYFTQKLFTKQIQHNFIESDFQSLGLRQIIHSELSISESATPGKGFARIEVHGMLNVRTVLLFGPYAGPCWGLI